MIVLKFHSKTWRNKSQQTRFVHKKHTKQQQRKHKTLAQWLQSWYLKDVPTRLVFHGPRSTRARIINN